MHSSNPCEDSILEMMAENGFQQLETSGFGQLDVVLCTNPELVVTSYCDVEFHDLYKTNDRHCSDHRPYTTVLSSPTGVYEHWKPRDKDWDFSSYSYKKLDYENLSREIAAYPFTPHCYSSVNVLFQHWYSWLHEKVSSNAPPVTKHRKSLPRGRPASVPK